MSRIRFNIFNAEEFDESVDLGGDAEVSATDSIEAETQAVEMEQDVAEVEEVMASTEEAEQVADELTEQVEEQEKVLEETPEEVTEDTVAVAQEAFFISMSKIGALKDYKDMKGSLGLESASSPAEKLKLACEGVWDFIKALIARIKMAISKVKELIKKLYIKFLVFFTNLKKKAEALAKSLNSLEGSKTITLNEEQIDKVSKTFKCFIAAGAIKSTKELYKVVDIVINSKTSVLKISKLDLESKPVEDVFTKLAVTKNSNAIYAPYYVKNKIRALVVNPTDVDNAIGYETLTIDNDGKVSSEAPTVTELKAILSQLSKSENGLKSLVETAKKSQDAAYKELDEAEKTVLKAMDKSGFVDRMRAKNQLILLRRIGTNVILDVVLNYIYNMKNVLAISAMIAKELSKK